MIPYMVGKFAPNSSHLTRELVKYVPGRIYFRAVPSQNGDKIVTSPPPPPIVERVCVFIKLHITAQSDPVIYSLYATACNPPEGYVLWTYCCLEIRV